MKDYKTDSVEGENSHDQASLSIASGLENVVTSSPDKKGAAVAVSSVEEGETRNSPSNQETEIDWKLLPPLPTPDEAKDNEFRCGFCMLGGGGAICFIVVQSVFGSLDAQDDIVSSIFVIAVSVFWLSEMICLLAIYHKDPGVVARSETTCYPIPSQVQPYIRSYIQMQQQSQQNQPDEDTNVQISRPSELYITMEDENNGAGDEGTATFCVRCLVWRREKTKYFHCNTCQRCVSHFDHHCNVFGRCIAGRLPFQGNLLYFYIAVGVSILLWATTVVGLVWKLGLSRFFY